MESLKSRKFLSTMLVIFMAYGLVFAGKLDAKAWLDMAVIGVGIYAGANVAQKAMVK